jgi:hypothetical protein
LELPSEGKGHTFDRVGAPYGKFLEEIGLDDGVTALQQLGLIRAA